MKERILYSLILLSLFTQLRSQDVAFNNSYQSLVYLNPSFAGSNGLIRNQLTYRNQWPSLSSNYVTFSNSFDMFLNKIKGGVALNYLHDDQARGTLMSDVFNISYAQYLYLCDKQLKIIPSLQFGGFVKRLDLEKISFDQTRCGPFVCQPITPASRKSNIDLSSGLLINYKKFYFGTSVFHITQPDEGFLGVSKLPYRLSMHSSYNLTVGPKTILNFFVRFDKQQHFEYLNLKMNALLINHLVLGIGIHSADVLNANIGYRNDLFVLSLGHEHWYSELSTSTAQAWEFQASFNLRTKENRKVITNFEAW